MTQKLYACAEYYRERPEKGTDQTLGERAGTAVDYRKSQDTLYESFEQAGSSTAANSHKSQKTSSESIELKRTGRVEGYEGITRGRC